MDRRKFLGCACLGCAGVAASSAVVLHDAINIEPNKLEITRHRVKFQNYPANMEPLKILQLSDIHRGRYISEEHIRNLVPICNKLEPDLIVITGDFISVKTKYALSSATALSGLKSRLGIYGVMGNQDYEAEGTDNVFRTMRDSGIHMIKNGNVNLFENVWLIGIDDIRAGRPDVKAAFDGVPDDSARIVISHSPRIFPQIRDMNVFAMIGHTHGGQFNLPLIPRNMLPGLFTWKYIKGWYEEGNSRMYVNRGIGMVTLPIRYRCPPEITLFTCDPA